jgi:hypothetical protein
MATHKWCPLHRQPFLLQEKKNDDEALEAKKRKRLERDPLHQGLIVARANLKARDYQIDLASKLNKTQVRPCWAEVWRLMLARQRWLFVSKIPCTASWWLVVPLLAGTWVAL